METGGKFRIVAAVCVLIVSLTAAVPGRIIHVDDDATGAADGTSWVNAFPYLQDALAAANQGDEIRVAQGTYRPNQGVTVVPIPGGRGHTPEIEIGPRYRPFRLKNGLTVRGGFAGIGANDPNAREVKRYETILSGDLNGDDAAGWLPEDPVYESTRTDNIRVVVESEAAVLDGCVIQSATESGLHNTDGGLRVMNCTFHWNSAGGLFCYGGRSDLENCLFKENSRGSGGGMMASGRTYRTTHGEVTVPARLTLRECRFLNNSAWSGGAICTGDSHLSLIACSFEGNTARTGAAVQQFRGSLALQDCRFEGNLAIQSGGAVDLLNLETATVTRCSFRGNRAVWGGAISNQEGPLTLDSSIFNGNRAEFGGAIEVVSASWSTVPPGRNDILMRGCFFTGNLALESGAALYAGPRAEFTITSCTFADNWARTAGWSGSTAYRVTMDNCILWDGSESIAPSLYVSARSRSLLESDPVIIRYSDVRGGWRGDGNIEADPLFAAPGHWADASDPTVSVKADHPSATWIEGDYHLQSQAGRWDPMKQDWVQDAVTSPCIDAGDPKGPAGDEPEPNGGRINMGAYGGTVEASKSLLR